MDAGSIKCSPHRSHESSAFGSPLKRGTRKRCHCVFETLLCTRLAMVQRVEEVPCKAQQEHVSTRWFSLRTWRFRARQQSVLPQLLCFLAALLRAVVGQAHG